ncbi:metallophosphoesterase [Dyadobacter sp. CY345]|uniref:metallophosphoesterase n=1 Tax=Dyadobacter sp. CY345 TaxID=2909335 RepID=UPI001F2F3CE3|nr:metallophosphoesterase [Dyadobacter sp. CY345]MCF2445766.1 metallophosphoesterase [Dyadobacter sp. CY345]
MRIIQLSDIHLSIQNLQDLRNYYIEALVEDLSKFHKSTPIDIILFTGDLVDKGGSSLGEQFYQHFQNEVVHPIADKLKFPLDRIFFVPGNHDINREEIDEQAEFFLSSKLTKDLANNELIKMRNEFTRSNERIKKFKDFESNFHSNTIDYVYSNNESLAVITIGEKKIGLALLNDSWRCSSDLKTEQHFIGYNQLFNAKRHFSAAGTFINIAIFHHPLDAINQSEREEVENILKSQDFEIAFFGHSHRHRADSIISSSGGYLSLNGRSAFDNSKETSSLFQLGYNLLDVNLEDKSYVLYAQKFIRLNGYRFDKDTDALPGGIMAGKLPSKNNYFKLAEQSNNDDRELPDGYTADVQRIVKLLIGKSLYPNPYIFIRELIQNSVDACNRVKERYTHLSPKIIINVDSKDNYIEVVDEGDGMSKSVLKNHFSVIGKSISQEFNDSTGNFNLISQFGIGFISTFIVAEKVVINTKSEGDEQVTFEIQDVFKGFNYKSADSENLIASSGTSIRVYLKRDYDVKTSYAHVSRFCRHIENLDVYLDKSKVHNEESWNTENSIYEYTDKNVKYEVRLGIGSSHRFLYACISGFLITQYSHEIVPYKFPYIIGGEVNFKPKGIDFDVSRSNIISSQKSEAFRREISVALRKLFREVLEGGNLREVSTLLDYIYYYLQYYDQDQARMNESYTDFFSKKELIGLCGEYTIVPFQGSFQTLSNVLYNLRLQSFTTIYFIMDPVISDYRSIVIQYLENKGNLIVKDRNVNVQFRDGAYAISSYSIFQTICSEYGIAVHNINNVSAEVLADMKMDKTQFSSKLLRLLSEIEKNYAIQVEIGKFSSVTKPSVNDGFVFFLNFNHETFQSILRKIDLVSDEVFEIYLLGILGLGLN